MRAFAITRGGSTSCERSSPRANAARVRYMRVFPRDFPASPGWEIFPSVAQQVCGGHVRAGIATQRCLREAAQVTHYQTSCGGYDGAGPSRQARARCSSARAGDAQENRGGRPTSGWRAPADFRGGRPTSGRKAPADSRAVSARHIKVLTLTGGICPGIRGRSHWKLRAFFHPLGGRPALDFLAVAPPNWPGEVQPRARPVSAHSAERPRWFSHEFFAPRPCKLCFRKETFGEFSCGRGRHQQVSGRAPRDLARARSAMVAAVPRNCRDRLNLWQRPDVIDSPPRSSRASFMQNPQLCACRWSAVTPWVRVGNHNFRIRREIFPRINSRTICLSSGTKTLCIRRATAGRSALSSKKQDE